MTFITFDWDGFRGYAENCHVGTYQVKQVVEGTEVRVRAGKLGFVGVYNLDVAEQRRAYELILQFCVLQQFISVERSVDDSQFHT